VREHIPDLDAHVKLAEELAPAGHHNSRELLVLLAG